MMQHVNPLYTVAMILSVAVVILILTGFIFVDWELIMRDIRRTVYKIKEKNSDEYDTEWMDFERWDDTQ